MKTSSAKIYAVLLLLAMVWGLSACSGLTRSDKPAVTSWWLEPFTADTPAKVTEPVVLLALVVKAVPGLDSNQVLTLSSDGQLKPFSGARWVDHAPELLSSLIGRSLEASGGYEVLTERSSWGAESCDLHLELREFFADLDATGRATGVRVAVNGRYQCGATEALQIESRAFIVVDEERMSIIVAAFQKAVDQVTRDILGQLQAAP